MSELSEKIRLGSDADKMQALSLWAKETRKRILEEINQERTDADRKAVREGNIHEALYFLEESLYEIVSSYIQEITAFYKQKKENEKEEKKCILIINWLRDNPLPDEVKESNLVTDTIDSIVREIDLYLFYDPSEVSDAGNHLENAKKMFSVFEERCKEFQRKVISFIEEKKWE